MAVQHRRKKKQAVPTAMLIALAVALVALGTAIALLVHMTKNSTPARRGTMSADIAEQTQQTTTQTEVTATSTTLSESGTTSATDVTTTGTALTSTTGTAESKLPDGLVSGITLTFYTANLTVGDAPVMPIVTMTPANATNKKEIWQSSNQAVAKVDGLGNITPVGAGECIITVTSASNPSVSAEVKVSVKGKETASGTPGGTTPQNADSKIQVVNGVTYVQGVLIVNKTYPLPADYNPGLDPTAQAAFNEMAAGAAAAGLSIQIVSGFRSYDTQKTLYNNYCNRDGKAEADRFSARPGHSEHQSGLAMDINYAGSSFDNTPEAKWLAENCWKYGFIIRYPKGKESITGYKYESWHVRYLGKEWAEKIYNSGLTLEEYFGIDSKYSY